MAPRQRGPSKSSTSTQQTLKRLGQRLRELRQERDLTQEDTATELGMLVENYARIEQGRLNVTVDTLVRIAQVLDVSVADLFLAPSGPAPKPGRPPKRNS